MSNINRLRQQKTDLAQRAENILSSSRDGLTASNKVTLHAIKKEMRDLEEQIIEAEQQRENDLNPRAEIVGRTRRESSMKRSVYAKLSDQIAANGMQPTQRSDSLGPFASFADQMQAIYNAARMGGSNTDPRLVEIQAALGANESVPAEGGFLVVPEFAAGLIKRIYDVSQIASRCFQMPVQSNRTILHAVDEDSRVDGSRWGGIQGFWLAEGATYTPTKPKFREMQLVASKLIGLIYSTEEMVDDGPAFEAFIREAVPQELAFLIDAAIMSGSGAGQPLGFQNSGAVVVVPKDMSQAPATLSTTNIINMWTRMWARSRETACWLINQDIEPQLIPLTLGSPSLAQILLYTPVGVSGNAGRYGKLFGKDVIPVEQASTLGQQGDISLVDLSQYLLAQRTASTRIDTSIHVAFLTGEQAWRFMLRLDGQPLWKKPLTPYKGSATKSPFITLAAR